MQIAQAESQVDNSPRISEAAAGTRSSNTAVLTLSRPERGGVSAFDAQDYSIIDFIPIINQWSALVQVGATLKIIFGDGSLIELLRFFPESSNHESNAPNHENQDAIGTVGQGSGSPDGSNGPLVRVSDTQLVAATEFAQSHWIIPSGSGDFDSRLGENSSQILGAAQTASDIAPLDLLLPEQLQAGLPPILPPDVLPIVTPAPPPPPPGPLPPPNQPPDAVADAATVAEGGAVTTINVLGNDTDPDSTLTAASITGFTQGANGTVVSNGDGTFIYTHNGSETVSDSFTYAVDDGAGGTDTATVIITITPVNDAPVVAQPIPDQSSPEDTCVAVHRPGRHLHRRRQRHAHLRRDAGYRRSAAGLAVVRSQHGNLFRHATG